MREFIQQILFVVLGCGTYFYGQLQCHIVKRPENRTRSEIEAHGNIDHDTGCNISSGWNLTGRDWGCCGNYEGCCKMASKFCYFHDKICQCCRLGWLICGPECKPDVECLSDTQEVNTSLSDLNTLFSSLSPLSSNPIRSSSSLNNGTDDSNDTIKALTNISKELVDRNGASEEQKLSYFTTSQVQTQPKDKTKPDDELKTKSHVPKTFLHSKYFEERNAGKNMGILNSDLEFFSLDANTKHQNINEGSGDME